MKRLAFLAVVGLSFSIDVGATNTTQAASYAGQESREIKALSAEDVQAYLSGKGMGLAKAAELNGYPGPSHVLALSLQLNLTAEQKKLTAAQFAAMEESAVTYGRPLVEEERRLDQMFASKTITPELLSASLERIGQLQAKLRAVHLAAHLVQFRIMTSDQVVLYMRLRGYTKEQEATEPKHHQHSSTKQTLNSEMSIRQLTPVAP
jgi:hypothetical protein